MHFKVMYMLSDSPQRMPQCLLEKILCIGDPEVELDGNRARPSIKLSSPRAQSFIFKLWNTQTCIRIFEGRSFLGTKNSLDDNDDETSVSQWVSLCDGNAIRGSM